MGNDPQDLHGIEERIEQAPDDMGLLLARACMLDMLGRNDDARDAYIASSGATVRT
jgi:Flp pilus assembly protein TadD